MTASHHCRSLLLSKLEGGGGGVNGVKINPFSNMKSDSESADLGMKHYDDYVGKGDRVCYSITK